MNDEGYSFNNQSYQDREDMYKHPQPWGLIVNMIYGGPTGTGSSKNSRKAYPQKVMQVEKEAPTHAKTDVTKTFGDSNLNGIVDPLVIILMIGNSLINRVLVDNEASIDILCHDAYWRWNIMIHNWLLPLYQYMDWVEWNLKLKEYTTPHD